jgi:hypothetical protein
MTHPRLEYHAKISVPVLRVSTVKTKTIQHVALALSESRTEGAVPSEGDVAKKPSELISLLSIVVGWRSVRRTSLGIDEKGFASTAAHTDRI